MLQPKEYCPRCQAVRNMTVSVSRREGVDSKGNRKTILTKSFHCETCHSFVRSEDTEDTGEVGENEAAERIHKKTRHLR